jgi:hypothetical protein
LTALRYAFTNGFPTREYEARARRRFSEIVDKEELFEIPIDILRRIVQIELQETDFDKLFNCLKRCLDRFGSCGSILFQGVQLRHFSMSQLQELLDRRDFLWCFLADGGCDTLSLCLSEMAKHQSRFEIEHRDLCALQTEYRRVVAEYEVCIRKETEVFARLSSVERSLASLQRFETSAMARLEKLESESVTKSDANCLELRCASKASVEEELNLLKRVTHNFVSNPRAPLNGIIHHLTAECGGNVHDRGIVAITADRPHDDSPRWAAKNIADLEADSFFDCASSPNMWVCYDFKEMRVILTDYSIRSRFDSVKQNLKSWVIEISVDGMDWTEADRHENSDELCAPNVVRSFALSKPLVCR